MPTRNPRINIVLDDIMFQNISFLAKKQNVSLSAKARELIKEALELQEDTGLAELAEKRDNSWEDAKSLSHDQAWS